MLSEENKQRVKRYFLVLLVVALIITLMIFISSLLPQNSQASLVATEHNQFLSSIFN